MSLLYQLKGLITRTIVKMLSCLGHVRFALLRSILFLFLFFSFFGAFPGGGVLSGKVGTGKNGPDRVPFRPPGFTNGPFFI